MLANIIIGVLLFFALTGSIFVYTLFIWNKAQSKIQEEVAMQMKLKAPSPFDNIIASGRDGMEIINDFIKKEFDKFLHNKLVGLEEEGADSIQAFLNISKGGKAFSDFITGFVVTLNSTMSDGLKRFFNRYYKVLDENGEVNENFTKYVAEWVNLSIRFLQMKFAIGDGEIDNYSVEYMKRVNKNLFIQLETEVYGSYGITNVKIEQQPIKQEKQKM